jgi:hypothetical protein
VRFFAFGFAFVVLFDLVCALGALFVFFFAVFAIADSATASLIQIILNSCVQRPLATSDF